MRTLARSDVGHADSRIVLRRENSKNKEPRALPLVGGLAKLIERRRGAREHRTPDRTTALSPLVFHTAGRPIGDFRKAWGTACIQAGFFHVVAIDAETTRIVPSRLFHDLRRSAVRNMERAGVSQTVAMRITGHRTDSVYRRYRIASENDTREALAKTQAAVAAERGQAPMVTPLRKAAEQG